MLNLNIKIEIYTVDYTYKKSKFLFLELKNIISLKITYNEVLLPGLENTTSFVINYDDVKFSDRQAGHSSQHII